jgi:hypothetical protein
MNACTVRLINVMKRRYAKQCLHMTADESCKCTRPLEGMYLYIQWRRAYKHCWCMYCVCKKKGNVTHTYSSMYVCIHTQTHVCTAIHQYTGQAERPHRTRITCTHALMHMGLMICSRSGLLNKTKVLKTAVVAIVGRP